MQIQLIIMEKYLPGSLADKLGSIDELRKQDGLPSRMISQVFVKKGGVKHNYSRPKKINKSPMPVTSQELLLAPAKPKIVFDIFAREEGKKVHEPVKPYVRPPAIYDNPDWSKIYNL
jgi:hypothetical protein